MDLSADMELTTGSPRMIALGELETTVERLADLAEPIMSYWEMISEGGFRAVTRKALVEYESAVQRDIEQGQSTADVPLRVKGGREEVKMASSELSPRPVLQKVRDSLESLRAPQYPLELILLIRLHIRKFEILRQSHDF